MSINHEKIKEARNLAQMGNFLEAGWVGFQAIIMNKELDSNPEILDELRNAYYAGALSILSNVDNFQDEPDKLKTIQNEMEMFMLSKRRT